MAKQNNVNAHIRELQQTDKGNNKLRVDKKDRDVDDVRAYRTLREQNKWGSEL